MYDGCDRNGWSRSLGRSSKFSDAAFAERPKPPTNGSAIPATRAPARMLAPTKADSRPTKPMADRGREGPRFGRAEPEEVRAMDDTLRVETPRTDKALRLSLPRGRGISARTHFTL